MVKEGAAAGWPEKNIFPRSVHAATVDIGREGLFRRGAASFQNHLPIPNEQLAPPQIDLFSFGFFTAIKKWSPQLLAIAAAAACVPESRPWINNSGARFHLRPPPAQLSPRRIKLRFGLKYVVLYFRNRGNHVAAPPGGRIERLQVDSPSF